MEEVRCVFCRRPTSTSDLMCEACANVISDRRYNVPRWVPGWVLDLMRLAKINSLLPNSDLSGESIQRHE